MIVICYGDGELELSGMADELREVGRVILDLVRSEAASASYAAQTDADPKPYERCLSGLRVRRGDGPVRVSVTANGGLVISGAGEHLERFASWFAFDDRARPGDHGHFEYFEGNPYIAEDSIPLVVAIRE